MNAIWRPDMDRRCTWPDAHCVAVGNRYLALAVRCFAAAGMSDADISRHMLAATAVRFDDTEGRDIAA